MFKIAIKILTFKAVLKMHLELSFYYLAIKIVIKAKKELKVNLI